jgi:hypothetical protein
MVATAAAQPIIGFSDVRRWLLIDGEPALPPLAGGSTKRMQARQSPASPPWRGRSLPLTRALS